MIQVWSQSQRGMEIEWKRVASRVRTIWSQGSSWPSKSSIPVSVEWIISKCRYSFMLAKIPRCRRSTPCPTPKTKPMQLRLFVRIFTMRQPKGVTRASALEEEHTCSILWNVFSATVRRAKMRIHTRVALKPGRIKPLSRSGIFPSIFHALYRGFEDARPREWRERNVFGL